MQPTTTPTAEAHVVVRSRNVELTEELRSRASGRAERLLAANPHIRQIALTLERDGAAGTQPVLAKAEVMFGGPALLTSVTAADEAQALDYLLEKVEHQMRRQRAPRQSQLARRPPPLRSAGQGVTVPGANAMADRRTSR